MQSSNKLEQIDQLIDAEDYETSLAILEECIEKEPGELTYYWYLGLAYLLQENEELAQEIWFSILLQGNPEESEQWTSELIQFLEIKITENISKGNLGNAKVIYENITFIQPEYENKDLQGKFSNQLGQVASSLCIEQQYKQAIPIYQEALLLNPEDDNLWHSFAWACYSGDYYQDAEQAIRQAITLNTENVANRHILGLVLEKLERYDEAILAYKDALNLDDKFIDSSEALAKLYISLDRHKQAIEIYYSSLENAQKKLPLAQKIAKLYDQIGDEANSYLVLGNAAYSDKNYPLAVRNFEQYLISSENRTIDFYFKFAQSYIQADQAKKAISLMENHGLIDFPDSLIIKRLNQSILPVLYENQEEIDFYRGRFVNLLDELIASTKIESKEDELEVLEMMTRITNFHLPYQGRNDIDIKKKYTQYVYGLANSLCPQWCKPIDPRAITKNRPIRVGFISLKFHELGRLYLNWIKKINKKNFNIFIYDLSGKNEEQLSSLQREFRQSASSYVVIYKMYDLGGLCQKITKDELDILVIPEIGIDAVFEFLSCLRLAPIQCTTWAHPVTSGSPTIDYFLSSELMEPPDGDKHYSEKLIKLPNLAFSLRPIILPNLTKKRTDFQLRENAVVYLCSQSLFKYLPCHDYIFAAIAQHSEKFQFVFLDPAQGAVFTRKFEKRLAREFKAYGLNYQDYCVFLPRSQEEEYLMLCQLADIFLDCLSWSGGFTTQDAIVSGLPVVTCPSGLMRGRHSYGILQMLGVTETIAQTETEYVEIAVRLGLDRGWREKVSNKVKVNQDRIFNDDQCIFALENFFEQVTCYLKLGHGGNFPSKLGD